MRQLLDTIRAIVTGGASGFGYAVAERVIAGNGSVALLDIDCARGKGGVAGVTLLLAREFAAFGVRVVAIAPGTFAPPMFDGFPEFVRLGLIAVTPFPKRPGHAREFAALVLHIVRNPMLNGTVIRLDGTLRMSSGSGPPV